MEEPLQLASTYGFPMVAAFYLLICLEPIIKELQKSVTILTMVVAKLGGVDYPEVKSLVEGGYK